MANYDLNLKPRNGREREKKLIGMKLIELGYTVIAWNHLYYGKLNQQIKPNPLLELSPLDYKITDKYRNIISIKKNLRQFTRITVSVEELNDAQALVSNHEGIKRFDILAASTSNGKVFTYLCTTADIDIISLDFTRRIQFPINKKTIDIAVKRGIHFEIQYAPIISAPATRRQVTSSIAIILQYLKGNNIIFSSGTETSSNLRSPLDLSILARLLGIPIHKSHKILSDNCSQVIKHAMARKMRYLPIEFLSADEFRSKWIEAQLSEVQGEDQKQNNDIYNNQNENDENNDSDESDDEINNLGDLNNNDNNNNEDNNNNGNNNTNNNNTNNDDIQEEKNEEGVENIDNQTSLAFITSVEEETEDINDEDNLNEVVGEDPSEIDLLIDRQPNDFGSEFVSLGSYKTDYSKKNNKSSTSTSSSSFKRLLNQNNDKKRKNSESNPKSPVNSNSNSKPNSKNSSNNSNNTGNKSKKLRIGK